MAEPKVKSNQESAEATIAPTNTPDQSMYEGFSITAMSAEPVCAAGGIGFLAVMKFEE
jgi:hypothetical protein